MSLGLVKPRLIFCAAWIHKNTVRQLGMFGNPISRRSPMGNYISIFYQKKNIILVITPKVPENDYFFLQKVFLCATITENKVSLLRTKRS